MSKTLKPCPFCGGKARITEVARQDNSLRPDILYFFAVECSVCEAVVLGDCVGNEYKSESDLGYEFKDCIGATKAIDHWNLRRFEMR